MASGGDPGRRLDRAPGERYRAAEGAAAPAGAGAGEAAEAGADRGNPRRSLGAGLVATAGMGLLYAVIGSFDLGAGLLAVAGFAGWAVAVALAWGAGSRPLPGRRRRVAIASALGAGAIVLGFLLLWAWSRIEGGVLDPVGLLDQRFGAAFGALQVLVAAIVAGLRAR
jgi:hypothetical protein